MKKLIELLQEDIIKNDQKDNLHSWMKRLNILNILILSNLLNLKQFELLLLNHCDIAQKQAYKSTLKSNLHI